jgi:hypothetical protein
MSSSNTPSSSAAAAGSIDSSAARRNSKRPKYSKFTQQELPACKPILTPGWVISTFLIISVIFIPLGVISLFASQDVSDHDPVLIFVSLLSISNVSTLMRRLLRSLIGMIVHAYLYLIGLTRLHTFKELEINLVPGR